MPLSPRKLGTSLRMRGKLTLRKKEIIFFIIYIRIFDDILCRILRYHSSRCGSVLLIRMLATAQE